ncbi:MAG: hypothetical protein C0596_09670 [Marinilabiliales bacterium]|nr:MAG: hypothetical protein C0596_09670 [Marinilabiliales bacterium]
MKRILLLIAGALFSVIGFAQTGGELDVSVSTSEAGGQYSPRNCVVIWVEDSEGNFVKTLLSYAQMYRIYLTNWKNSTSAAGVAYNTTDAITGSTVNTHGTRTCSWDGTNYQGNDVADGTYRLCMELTDKNATGNYSYFTFTKADADDSQTPSDVPSFSDIVFSWAPSDNAINEETLSKITVLPNPTTGIIEVNAEGLINVEVWNVAGKKVMESSEERLDISNQANGMYFIRLKTDDGTFTRRVLKK